MLPMTSINLQQHPFPVWLEKAGYHGGVAPGSRILTDETINLEGLYKDIEEDFRVSEQDRSQLLGILDYAIFQAIAFPVTGIRNDASKTCPYHSTIAASLLSGDSIISFNYDSLMDDALLYHCPLWHPLDGYGIQFDDVMGGTVTGKEKPFRSSVNLFKPHGSVTFRYRDLAILLKSEIMYVGLHKGIQALPMAITGGWKPMIVPPSSNKYLHHLFMQSQIRSAKRHITAAQELVIVGYSFPEHDAHIEQLFVDFSGKLTIINPDWRSLDYKQRVRSYGLPNYKGFPDFEHYFSNE